MMKPLLTMSMSSVKPATALAIGGAWKREPMRRKICVIASEADARTSAKAKK